MRSYLRGLGFRASWLWGFRLYEVVLPGRISASGLKVFRVSGFGLRPKPWCLPGKPEEAENHRVDGGMLCERSKAAWRPLGPRRPLVHKGPSTGSQLRSDNRALADSRFFRAKLKACRSRVAWEQIPAPRTPRELCASSADCLLPCHRLYHLPPPILLQIRHLHA